MVPYNAVELHPNGYVSPCCKISDSDNNSPYRNNIKLFNSDESKAWRAEKFEKETLDPICKACNISGNVFSYKKLTEFAFKNMWKFPDTTANNAAIRKLIIGIDNICASSCIECKTSSSTTINNLAKNSKENNIVKKYFGELPGLIQYDLSTLDNCLDDLEVLHLYGGEPLFSPNLKTLINKVKNKSKRLQAITLSTGLSKIKESHVELLASTGVTVRVSLSVDGPLELNHWIRGISPDEFLNNFELLKKYNFNIVGPQTTIGSYNIFAFPEFVEFISKLIPNNQQRIRIVSAIITAPPELHPKQLPDEIKIKIIDKLNSFLITSKTSGYIFQYKEFIETALFCLNQPSTLPWDRCLERINILPKWRNSQFDFNYWVHRYLT